MAFGDKRRKTPVGELVPEAPYEAPLDVRQIANLTYGSEGMMADYYEPMALTLADTKPDKSAMRVVVLLHDDPVAGSRADVMSMAMEMAHRGLGVYCVGLSHGNKEGTPFFMENVDNLFAFLFDLAHDHHRLGLQPETYRQAGNRVILLGCGTGAVLAGVAMRLYHNARMREYFAASCPAVRRYFGMGEKSLVDPKDTIRIGAFVSMNGYLHPAREDWRALEAWCGKDVSGRRLSTYLDFTRYVSESYPPILLVASAEATMRRHADDVAAALPAACRRTIELPPMDEEGHALDTMFWVKHPTWTRSKELYAQIVSYCKSI